jgi:hypothetical protein
MSEPLPILIENSIQIAWDFLERSGEITNPAEASRFLQNKITELVVTGECRKLMLSKRAIDAYRRFKQALAAWSIQIARSVLGLAGSARTTQTCPGQRMNMAVSQGCLVRVRALTRWDKGP